MARKARPGIGGSGSSLPKPLGAGRGEDSRGEQRRHGKKALALHGVPRKGTVRWSQAASLSANHGASAARR